jgi:hypothetical protein
VPSIFAQETTNPWKYLEETFLYTNKQIKQQKLKSSAFTWPSRALHRNFRHNCLLKSISSVITMAACKHLKTWNRTIT